MRPSTNIFETPHDGRERTAAHLARMPYQRLKLHKEGRPTVTMSIPLSLHLPFIVHQMSQQLIVNGTAPSTFIFGHFECSMLWCFPPSLQRFQ